jgi:hypothetical protein
MDGYMLRAVTQQRAPPQVSACCDKHTDSTPIVFFVARIVLAGASWVHTRYQSGYLPCRQSLHGQYLGGGGSGYLQPQQDPRSPARPPMAETMQVNTGNTPAGGLEQAIVRQEHSCCN